MKIFSWHQSFSSSHSCTLRNSKQSVAARNTGKVTSLLLLQIVEAAPPFAVESELAVLQRF
jgi:hypothetical protein